MKKNTKIITLVVASALILGAAIGISASATSAAPEIISQNVEYGGNYALLYAVKADSVVGDSVSIAVYDNAECAGEALFAKTIAAKPENTENVRGYSCYVFTTNGIAAKNMDTQYYVKISAANGETVKRYSIAEYLYERLYKNGVAYSTDEGDVKRAELYNTVLLYGKQAQDVLYNYDANTENNRDYFVTDMKYVYVEDATGTVDGDYSTAIIRSGNKVKINATGTTPAYDLYDLVTGKKISTVAPGTEVAVNTHIKAVSYNPYAASKYADVAENYNGKSFSDLSSFITVLRNHWAKEESITDSALRINSKQAGEELYSFKNLTALTENYVFETDLRLVNVSTGREITFMLTSNPASVGTLYGMGFYVGFGTGANEGYLVLRALGNGTKEYNLGISASSTTNDSGWLNIRYEVDGLSAGSATRFIINGVVVDSFYSNRAIPDAAAMQFTLPGTSGSSAGPVGNFYFDNTYSGAKKNDTISFGSRGNGAYYEESVKFEGASYDSLIASGVLNAHATYGLGNGRSLLFNDGAMTWKSTESYAAWGALNFAASNTMTSNAVFEADIKITGFIGDSNRPTYLCGSSSAGASLASAYAFNLQFCNADGGYAVKIANCADSYVIPENTWVNIRYEFDGFKAGDATRLLINGEVVLETVNSQAISFNSVDILAQSNYGGSGFGVGTISFDNAYLGAKK